MSAVTFDRDTFAAALREVAGAVTRGPWAVLQCVLIETGAVAKLTTANEIFQVCREVERADQRFTTNLSLHHGGVTAYRAEHGREPEMSVQFRSNVEWLDRNAEAAA